MLNNYINENNDRIRSYNLKSSLKPEGEPTDTESNFSEAPTNEGNKGDRQIQIFDRFNIILSIFAQRAHSEMSQLQIELAYLKYIKSRLARGGHANYEKIYKEFKGSFFTDHATNFEVVSGKQSTVKGSVGGSGETQLELEKRKVSLREGQIKEILAKLTERRKIEREYRREKASSIPTFALLGYTNAGKTALMNSMAGTSLESENKLFQTLTTIIKR
jgi:GTP-binding protein HflX